jgi:GNAT superfamily N-acetyltransferase
VGGMLLGAAEEWARQRGLTRITVETGARNERALWLYRSHDFADEDIRLTRVLT